MPNTPSGQSYIAFAGTRRIAAGDLRTVALAAKRAVAEEAHVQALVFDSVTSRPVELDLRGSEEDLLGRLTPSPSASPSDDDCASGGPAQPTTPRPGRPKLGVVGKEVTLLPRHWEWLASQPGGASVTLRKLVEKARRENAGDDARREARDSAYRFMLTMAGNQPGFEEATRALYAGDAEKFSAMTESWPADVREHALALTASTFSFDAGESSADR